MFLVIYSRRNEFLFEFHLSSYARTDVKIHKKSTVFNDKVIHTFMVVLKGERNCRFGNENSYLI